ncbi:DUF916 and DUF3324 domain-containing protein [Enterococcus casseliflavus]|uniref:DUF916 and DUF3324 domain-containing protein n=1 Tax=Enterococcus casseliflavus TaxID=37734 RepID=UPI0012E1EFE2|nr:DUF916 and DUF3324 domain-containing protein [Enterococcus casseliflavus]MUN75697.1 DUF3324 domain-containing protein [Enterococcus casseliflavus]MUN98337.1 DUF3324 domain-containing protein [Enterococcus casseliflavus]
MRHKQAMPSSLLLLAVLFFFFPLSAQAEETALNTHVTPLFPESQVDESKGYYELLLAPGQKETLQLKVGNSSSEPINVQVTPHTAYTNTLGNVEYGKDAKEADPTLVHSLDELMTPSEVITLAGKETKVIDIPLQMPNNAFEGYLAGGLRIAEINEEAESEVPEGEGVAIKNEFAHVIGVVVSNTGDSVQPELELLDVFADQLNYRNVISATLQNFTPAFVNRLEVEATVKRAGESDVLYEASKEMMQMAPNSNFNFPISLEGDRFRSGNYVLELTAKSGDNEWSWTREFTIDADDARKLNREDVMIDNTPNWWMISALILLAVLLIISGWWLIKKRKENKSGEEKDNEKEK